MRTTSDAAPAISSLRAHRRASKLYPEDALSWSAAPLTGVQAGVSVAGLVFPASRVPQRGHSAPAPPAPARRGSPRPHDPTITRVAPLPSPPPPGGGGPPPPPPHRLP